MRHRRRPGKTQRGRDVWSHQALPTTQVVAATPQAGPAQSVILARTPGGETRWCVRESSTMPRGPDLVVAVKRDTPRCADHPQTRPATATTGPDDQAVWQCRHPHHHWATPRWRRGWPRAFSPHLQQLAAAGHHQGLPAAVAGQESTGQSISWADLFHATHRQCRLETMVLRFARELGARVHRGLRPAARR